MQDKPTSDQSTLALSEISQETLAKLASRDKDIRDSGIVDLFEQNLPQVPAHYVFKDRDRQFTSDALYAVFDLIGGVPKMAQWAMQNPGEYYKLFARTMPEAEKAQQAPAITQIFHAAAPSPLDGDVVDVEATPKKEE